MGQCRISASELASLKTSIGNFMCDKSTNMKAYSDLVKSFEGCYKMFTPETDKSNDLRILEFQSLMSSGSWDGDIVVTMDKDVMLVTDGIHRGIAFLRCIEEGLSEDDLPTLTLDTKSTL